MAGLVTLGWDGIDWIERYLQHGPGDVEGRPVELDDESASCVLRMYELKPRRRCAACRLAVDPRWLEETPWRCGGCGELLPVRRAWTEVQLSRPKGWAKSEKAGMLCALEALGPCRFDGWNAAGEPVARPQSYPFIRCLATEETQAGNTFGNTAFMLHPDTCSDALKDDYPRIDAGRDWQTSTRIYLPDGGEIRPSTSSSASKDGGKETFTVEDEPHLWYTSELKSMHATVHRNAFKRKAAEPWLLQTTTNFRPGQGSVAEEFARDAARGTPGLLRLHREASRSIEDLIRSQDDPDVDDVVDLLTEAFGDASAFLDLENMAEGAISGRYFEVDRYLGNRETTHSDDWADLDEWDARSRRRDKHGDPVPTEPPPEGLRIGLGFDGSYGTADDRIPDSTFLRGVVVEEGDWHGYLWTVGGWEADGDSDWQPPFDQVDATVDDTFRRYDVWRMYGDPAYWRDQLRKWQGTHGEDRVVEWPTNRDRQMAHALEDLRVALAGDLLTHDGDPRVRSHYANARTHVKKARVERDDPDGKKELVLVRKDSPRSARKIDAVVTDALAWAVRGDAVATGAHKVRRKARAFGF